MAQEQDILYEIGSFWVSPASYGFTVWKAGTTHSTRCAQIGYTGLEGLERAKAEARRRNYIDQTKEEQKS